jgi:hypothetical protein
MEPQMNADQRESIAAAFDVGTKRLRLFASIRGSTP